jgi:hypothetical protein
MLPRVVFGSLMYDLSWQVTGTRMRVWNVNRVLPYIVKGKITQGPIRHAC